MAKKDRLSPIVENWFKNSPTIPTNQFNYFSFFRNMALTLFEIETDKLSPDEKRFINLHMLADEDIALVKIKDMYTVSKFQTKSNDLNRLGFPNRIQLVDYNNFKISPLHMKYVNYPDFVILRNAPVPLNLPYLFFERSQLIDELEQNYRTNLEFQKTPWIFNVANEDIYTVKRLLKSRRHNAPPEDLIVTMKNNAIKVPWEKIELGAEFLLDRLRLEREGIINDTLEKIGIHQNVEKLAQVTETELDYQNDRGNRNLMIMLTERETIEKEVKEKFNISLIFKYNNTAKLSPTTNDTTLSNRESYSNRTTIVNGETNS